MVVGLIAVYLLLFDTCCWVFRCLLRLCWILLLLAYLFVDVIVIDLIVA